MPAAARVMAEHGLKAADVPGTGPGGRVLKEDAQRVAEARSAAASPVSGSAAAGASGNGRPPGPRHEEVVPMTMLRRRIAERLVEAQRHAAILTTFNEIDMSAVLRLREQRQEEFVKRYGIKLGFMSFFVKAAIDSLKHFPAVNAEIRGTDIVYKHYYDIGVAVSTDRGLVVPVIRNAELLSFAEVEQRIAELAQRARDRKLEIEELQGGTFTISNGGVFGSLMSTPILNPPQSGILGLHATQERPVARDGQVVIRPMMYVALSYDHRIVDGRESVSFLKRIKECVEDPTRMLIEA
jgi:2-oxoglutarate dehydrogenase E2 component (dihydrolipoamide succinyltransferase)